MPCKEEEDESQPTNVSVPRETGETKGVKSRDPTCLGFALQEPMEQRAQSQTCLSYAKSWQRKENPRRKTKSTNAAYIQNFEIQKQYINKIWIT